MTRQQKSKNSALLSKEKNIPFILNEEAVREMVRRIAGDAYADKLRFIQIPAKKAGMDSFRISDADDGGILIEATSGVAAASAFKWYLENRCGSYVGPLTRRLNFPESPPKATEHSDESVCLYRYFLNYCTFGYTLAFWKWEQWQDLLDWMMLAGYNLVLNPIGNESVWIRILCENGYSEKQAENFLCSPVFYPWQCMINIESWAGAAPKHWYEDRIKLSRKINDYLRSFGAGIMLPGYCGMVPADFKEHFPDSNPLNQGLWCDMKRPSIILPTNPNFERIAESYYRHQKDLFGGDINYFSTDPFHEGGNSAGIELADYARKCLKYMKTVSEEPVWFLQGWQSNPLREMLRALSPSNVLIGNLRSTDVFDGGDDFADYPWLYCCVNNFGGQRNIHGNMNKMLKQAFEVVTDDRYTCVGIGIIPEGIEHDEILFDVFAAYSIHNKILSPDEWLKKQLIIRYGTCPDHTFEAWKIMRDEIYIGDTEKVARESALLSRPSLTVTRVSSFSPNEFSYDIERLFEVFRLLMQDFGKIDVSEPYRLDIVDIARQSLAYRGWKYIEGIQNSYRCGDDVLFERNVDMLMALYDAMEKLLCCDRHTMLGSWLELAKANGTTPAEKAYFEFLARTLITVWGDRAGATTLFDYAAREWSGMIEDYYRPRWQSYINILRRSLMEGKEPMEYNRYDAEYFFTTLSDEYPTVPYGNLNQALKHILELVGNDNS